MTRDEAAQEVAQVVHELAVKVRWCLMSDRPDEASRYAEACNELAQANWNLTGPGDEDG